MKKNLHLFLSDIVNESRLFREAEATVELGIFDRVSVLGLWEAGLPMHEVRADQLEVIRVRTWLRVLRVRHPSLRRGILWRSLMMGAFAQYSLAAVQLAFRMRPSHLCCHNLILLPTAVLAAKISGAALVYAPHELETEREGLKGPMKFISAWIEDRFIGFAQAVVSVCDPIASWYTKRYRLANVHVVRAIPAWTLPAGIGEWREAYRRKNRIPLDAVLFIYQGVLGRERGVDYLLEVFESPKNSHHLMFMGFGEAENRIKAACRRCPKIHFQPAVAAHQVLRHTAIADVGIFAINDRLSESYRLSLPNKFFEYLYAGLPVLVTKNLEYMAEIVVTHRMGWVVGGDEIPEQIKRIDADDIARKRQSASNFASLTNWQEARKIYREIYR